MKVRKMVVSVEKVLANDPTEQWVRNAATKLATSAYLLHRVAAIGLVGRLWMPPREAPKAPIIAALRRGVTFPPKRCREMALTLAPELIGEIEYEAIAEVHRLAEDVHELKSCGFSPDLMHSHLRSCVERRDNLESVKFVLAVTGRADVLVGALAGLDAVAARRIRVFKTLDVTADDRLGAVSWQEPYSWWGKLVLSRRVRRQ